MNRLLALFLLALLSLTARSQQRLDGNFGVGITVPVAVGDNKFENKYVDVVATGYYRLHLSSRIYANGELGLFYNRCSDGLADYVGMPLDEVPMKNNFGIRPGAVLGAHLNGLIDVFTGIYGRFVFGSECTYSRAMWQVGLGFNIKRFCILCSYDVMIGTSGGNAVAAGIRYNF